MMITIQRDGRTYGPYDRTEVRSMIQRGQLAPTDLASTDGVPAEVPLGRMQEFATLFPPGPERAGAANGTAMLTTLCIFTILGSIFGILRGLLYDLVADVAHASAYWRGWAMVVLGCGTLLGAIMMMSRSAAGWYLYSVCQVLYLGLVAYTMVHYLPEGGAFTLLVGAVFFLPSLVFLVLYWLPATRRALN